jgi:hypothetical protein
MINNKVSIGLTTIIGWTSALFALLPTVIKAVESGTTALAGPEKYLAIGGIVVGAITQIGRYLQAHKLIGVSTEIPFEEGTGVSLPPESAAKPDGPVNIPIANQSIPTTGQ